MMVVVAKVMVKVMMIMVETRFISVILLSFTQCNHLLVFALFLPSYVFSIHSSLFYRFVVSFIFLDDHVFFSIGLVLVQTWLSS